MERRKRDSRTGPARLRLLLLPALLLVAGCGRRGPLSLPAEAAPPPDREDETEKKEGR